MQALDQPVRYPCEERSLSLVHAQEHVIALQAFRDVEGGDIGDTKTGVNTQVDKVSGIVTTPCAVARALLCGRPDSVAGFIDAFQFLVREWTCIRRQDDPSEASRSP